jgi:hypothetical protein
MCTNFIPSFRIFSLSRAHWDSGHASAIVQSGRCAGSHDVFYLHLLLH